MQPIDSPGSLKTTCQEGTSHHINAPFNKPLIEEIEVTDPRHPLFGRRFEIRSISRQPGKPAQLLVRYKDHMQLRIPISVTSLAPNIVTTAYTKLSFSAVGELLAFVKESDALCQEIQRISGQGSKRTCKDKSSKTSQQCFKR